MEKFTSILCLFVCLLWHEQFCFFASDEDDAFLVFTGGDRMLRLVRAWTKREPFLSSRRQVGGMMNAI